MKPRVCVVILAALALMLLPATSEAHKRPILSLARARAAIVRVEHATVDRCHRVRALQVDCQVTELITEGEWSGWTLQFTAFAVLGPRGITVTSSL